MEGAIETFIDEVRVILDQEGPGERGMEQLVERMRGLVVHPDVLATHQAFVSGLASGDAAELNIDTGRRSRILYTDDTGLTLVRSRFDPDEATPVHSHSTWGIVGVYAGRDRHEAWRRLDDGTGAGHAVVELIETRTLGPGDVVVIPHPPQDIHRQQGAGGEEAWELVLFGANAMVEPRLVFDLDTDTARQIVPGQG
jgi:predicted metal-dependent enzyme (double-stranded beta helix superfamily)